MYVIEKILEDGYSCAFRQPNAVGTHCEQIHGYELAFKVRIECDSLDDRNWVFSFGEFKELKKYLKENFDHRTAIAQSDPHLDYFKQGHELGVLNLNVLPTVGCEAFAKQVFTWFRGWLHNNGHSDEANRNYKGQALRNFSDRSVQLKYVYCYERDGNMGGYEA